MYLVCMLFVPRSVLYRTQIAKHSGHRLPQLAFLFLERTRRSEPEHLLLLALMVKRLLECTTRASNDHALLMFAFSRLPAWASERKLTKVGSVRAFLPQLHAHCEVMDKKGSH